MGRARLLTTGVLAIPAALVALVSLRYLMSHPPHAPVNVMGNPFEWPALPIHATLSAVALLIGPFQLWGPVRRHGWHRGAGRVYIACCLGSAPFGLLLAAGATTGPIATAGFGLLSIIWFGVTALGLRAALDRRFEAHRRWMLRSYALTFGAVTLRLYLGIALATHMDFAPAYRVIAFLAWVPNLVLVEAWLRWGGATASVNPGRHLS